MIPTGCIGNDHGNGKWTCVLRRGPPRRAAVMIEVISIDTAALGDRSYLATDGRAALVVDPQRDIDRVLAAAAARGPGSPICSRPRSPSWTYAAHSNGPAAASTARSTSRYRICMPVSANGTEDLGVPLGAAGGRREDEADLFDGDRRGEQLLLDGLDRRAVAFDDESFQRERDLGSVQHELHFLALLAGLDPGEGECQVDIAQPHVERAAPGRTADQREAPDAVGGQVIASTGAAPHTASRTDEVSGRASSESSASRA